MCVFCGASMGTTAYQDAARRTGQAIAGRGLRLVFGGGRVGLMGVVADAALAAGGEVIGVIPDSLAELEIAHEGVTELLVVGSMHERKQRMHEHSDAFIALPGGFGTLDEMFETLTWRQLGYHGKPIGWLDVDGYYEALFAMMDRAVADGLLGAESRALCLRAQEPAALLDLCREAVGRSAES